jgi:hypothetical protein
MATEKIDFGDVSLRRRSLCRPVEGHFVDPSSKHRLAINYSTFLVSQANSSPSTYTYTQMALKAVPVLQRIITGVIMFTF